MASEDWEGMRIARKKDRAHNENLFDNEAKEKLIEMYDTKYNENQNKYTFDTFKFGLVDYFPRRNKLYIRKWNKYLYNGLAFIKKHMI